VTLESLNAGLLLDPLDLNTELFIPASLKDFISKVVELKLLTRPGLILERRLKLRASTSKSAEVSSKELSLVKLKLIIWLNSST
jgi:hypothetical protein